MDALEQLNAYEAEALEAISRANDEHALEEVRVTFLGKKQGRLRDLQKLMGAIPNEEKPTFGKRFNEVKTRVSQALEAKKASVTSEEKHVVEQFDVTIPGDPLCLGSRHPLTQTLDEFREITARLGFVTAEGPEIEDEHHNFVALNIAEDHPARDPLDNFYLASAKSATGEAMLMRSQTSTVQIRVMEQTPPPVRVVSLGRVYRPDDIDDTHSCMFHQMEGLWVEAGVTMAHLKTVLRMFAQAYLGPEVVVRFRPSFFPFTEPSVEVDMQWGEDWLEIGGAGMVDPNVLSAVGYDPEEVTGFAFGLGVERFCMRRHNIRDIRMLYANDIRFLSQF